VVKGYTLLKGKYAEAQFHQAADKAEKAEKTEPAAPRAKRAYTKRGTGKATAGTKA
jgi:hypothetical protein